MYLYEELFLLAINPELNRFEISPSIRIFRGCLAGAILRDLELNNRIRISTKYVDLIDLAPIGDYILDNVLTYLSHPHSKRNLHDLLYWIARHIPEIELFIAKKLVDQKIIDWASSHRKFVRIVNNVIWDQLNCNVFQWLIRKAPIDEHGLALLGVARWCGVLRHHFYSYEINDARKHLKDLIRFDRIAAAIESIITEEDNASAAAVIAACC